MWKHCATLICVLAILGLVSPVSASLIGHWPFDEDSGNVALDEAGNTPGTLQGGPLRVAGVRGGALWFDGTNDCVNMGSSDIFNPSGSFSVALWVNIENWSSEWLHTIIGNRSDGVGWCLRHAGGWWAQQDPTFTLPSDAICFTTRGITGAQSTEDTFSATAPPLNEWLHVTCIFDADQGLKLIYFNGVLSNTHEVTGDSVTPATQTFYIGARSNDADTDIEAPFSGSIDDVRYYNHALSAGEVQEAMTGFSRQLASAPAPADEEADVALDTNLSWNPGLYAVTHDVYFGTSFDDVNEASRTQPGAALVSQGQTETTYALAEELQLDTTYYWRVDEVNENPSTIFRGAVWSFMAEPTYFQEIPVGVTASSDAGEGYDPNNTINGSGLVNDLHATDSAIDAGSTGNMWKTAEGDVAGAWIQYEFAGPKKIGSMLVWNANPAYESILGVGIKEATVETSLDGQTWTDLAGTLTFNRATGKGSYAANTTIDFGGRVATYVRINVLSHWADLTTTVGLSEVRFMVIPIAARRPEPVSGSTLKSLTDQLVWRAGRDAQQHKLYIDTNEALVAAGDPGALVDTLTERHYDLGQTPLLYDMDYSWKVVEVSGDQEVDGPVWTFTTPTYQVVDDMESYDDTEGTRIFDSWIDGYTDNSNGSQVGYLNAPFAEQTTVYKGGQSMPFSYSNDYGAMLSEATLSLTPSQNWTLGGVQSMVLYFHGDPANTPAQLYIKINNTRIDYSGNPDHLSRRAWTPWSIDLSGLSLGAVSQVTIGVDNYGSGNGSLLIDEIRLYRIAPEETQPVVPTDPGTANLVASYSFEGNLQDTSGQGLNGTGVGSPSYASGISGQALLLDGASCVDLGNKPVWNPTGSFSVSLWANASSWNTDWGCVMIGNRGEGSQGWQIRRYASTNNICFTTRAVGGDDTQSKATMPLNEWVHIVCVYDMENSVKRIYVNGVYDISVNVDGGTVGTTVHNTYIGARANDGNTTQEGFFSGMLDKVRVYNKALDANEVDFLYEN